MVAGAEEDRARVAHGHPVDAVRGVPEGGCQAVAVDSGTGREYSGGGGKDVVDDGAGLTVDHLVGPRQDVPLQPVGRVPNGGVAVDSTGGEEAERPRRHCVHGGTGLG